MSNTPKRRPPRKGAQWSSGYAKLLANVIAELVARHEAKYKRP